MEPTQALANLQAIVQEYVTTLNQGGRPASANLVAGAAQDSLRTLQKALEPPKPPPAE